MNEKKIERIIFTWIESYLYSYDKSVSLTLIIIDVCMGNLYVTLCETCSESGPHSLEFGLPKPRKGVTFRTFYIYRGLITENRRQEGYKLGR